MDTQTPPSPIECGDVPEGMVSKQTVHAKAPNPRYARENYLLIEYTAGYEAAGSMARWTNAGWMVTTDGMPSCGRRGLSEEAARALFNKWTK